MTLAALISRAGDWLGFRYDFGDCWGPDVEVEKVHRAAKNTTYPPRYCGTPCRQAAHRARRRTTETAKRPAGLRDRLAADANPVGVGQRGAGDGPLTKTATRAAATMVSVRG